ncbi:hypothetical protein [Paraburkholderia sp. MM5482-R1]|uniref:hypothetical protein n=1 Tax=unclassified Paraburkholderia TaxID=2615204 RepID=UPI003D24C2D0
MIEPMGERQRARQQREVAARKYLPDSVELLLVAEAPPVADDRYFYFENVASHDHLFRHVAEVLLGETPSRLSKGQALEELKQRGVFLVDLKLDPIDGSDLTAYVDDLIERCKALKPRRIVLIKSSVYDVAYQRLRVVGLPVVDEKVYFPSSGRQNDFRRQFREALDAAAFE